MSIAIHILKFITLTALGFFSIPVIMLGALQLGVIDALPGDEHIYNFKLIYMGGGMIALMLACLVGAASFFTHGRTSTTFLLLPLVIPMLYSIAVLTYFTALS
jgi:hypothetical protein